VGVVVIGRNEGARLERCLAGLLRTGVPVVYADSGSSDASVEHARRAGARVVELDPSRPFSAARGRNEGFEALLTAAPNLEFVQFVDGDCELDPGWLEAAVASLTDHPERVLVCGRLRERAPGNSVYNRLCQLEWDEPVGPITSCGGLFMVRQQAFARLGGFDTSLISSEEPEFCARLAAAGGELFRIEAPMASHDADMERLREWWTRQQRCGYGDLDSALRFGQNQRRVVSVWLWSFGWLVASLAGMGVAGARAGVAGVAVLLAGALAIPVVQALRVARRSIAEGREGRDALTLGCFLVLGKWPRLQGQLRYLWDRIRGGPARLIEYRSGS
jgi:GT2 family glycosyltransferase